MKTTQNTEVPKLCFSYIRYSSRKQSKGDSLDRQMDIAPRVAKEKGWILREDFKAESLGKSGWKGDNIARLKSVISDTETGRIPQGSVMIIEAFDRLTRAELDIALALFLEILRAGIEIYIARGSRHFTKASLKNLTDIIIAIVELAAANEYSEKLSERMSGIWRKKKIRAADGIKLGRNAPKWLTPHTAIGANGKEYVTHYSINEHGTTVKRIFANYANGKGIRTIMRELNKDKIAPFGKGQQNLSGLWSSTHIRRILSFRGVLGEYQPCHNEDKKRIHEGDAIADYYPAVVEKPLFFKVQDLLSKTTKRASGPKANVTNLFSGIAKCTCGGTMVIKQSGTKFGKYSYTSLVCYNAMRGSGCKYHTIQYKWVERAILTLLFAVVVPKMMQADDRQDKLTTLQGELKNADRQRLKWAKVIEDTETDVEIKTAAQKLNNWETRKQALERQIESLSATINDKPLAAWQHVENIPENRLRMQTILHDLIESITIDAGKREALLFVKQPENNFYIKWPESIGTNANKTNPADFGFTCKCINKTFAYLDTALVWKSDHNISIEDLDQHVINPTEPITSIGDYIKTKGKLVLIDCET